jgi:hypothetical protein
VTTGIIVIEDTGVVLYQHGDAGDLPGLVRRVLSKGMNWDDPEYLARMIFCLMAAGDINGAYGYGISTRHRSDPNNYDYTVFVSCRHQHCEVYRPSSGTVEEFNFEECKEKLYEEAGRGNPKGV